MTYFDLGQAVSLGVLSFYVLHFFSSIAQSAGGDDLLQPGPGGEAASWAWRPLLRCAVLHARHMVSGALLASHPPARAAQHPKRRALVGYPLPGCNRTKGLPTTCMALNKPSEPARAQGREEIGIGENLVRYSCGVEDVEDLWADLEQALARM